MKKQSLSALLAVAYLLPLSAYAQQAPIATPVEAPRKIVKTIDFTKNSDVALFAQVNTPQAKPAQAVAVKAEAAKPQAKPAQAVAAKAEAAKPQAKPAQAVAVKAEAAKPQAKPAQAVAAKAEAAKPQAKPAQAVGVKAEAVKPQAKPAQAVAVKAEAAKPQAKPAQAVAVKAEAAKPQAKPAQAVAVKAEAAKPTAPAKAEVNIVKVIDFTQQDPFAAVDYSGKAVNQAAAQAASQKQAKVVAQSTAIAKSVTYNVRGKTYRTLSTAENFSEEGSASWYGPGFHGRKTASGEVYNMHDMTAAHKHLPLGSQVKVTNLNNGKSVIVRINDRGPFHGDRVIDLSKAAAQQLGVLQAGVAKVSIVTHK